MGERGGKLSPLAVAAVAVVALCGVAVAAAEVVSGGNARISFHGSITPRTLPRGRTAPISLHVAGAVHPIGGRRPAALERVKVEINRHGVISTRGLPICPPNRLRGARSVQALERCGGALVGIGHFTAHVEIPEGAPFPASGRLLVFNSRREGHPALVAHVFGTEPVPTTQVLPISLRLNGRNGFGATMSVAMPKVGDEWGYVTGFDMTFHRRYRYRGRSHSFLSASCPAPSGIAEAPFRAARGTYYLFGGRVLSRVVSGSCRVSPRRG
jgi:hypothetical protein